MTKTLCIASALAALAVTVTAAPVARAATYGEWIAFCVGGDAMIDATIKRDTLATCGLEEGIKAACSVLKDTPWVCSTPSSKTKEKSDCDSLKLNFSIGAGFKQPVGWTIAGKAKLKFLRVAFKTNTNVCDPAPVVPTPMGGGGTYSAESGDISFNIEITVEGELSVTSPLGIGANLDAKVGCERTTNAQYYKKAEINACTQATPTPAPTAPATPPPASPTPGSTPPATPPPATPTPPSTPPPATPMPTSTPRLRAR